MDALLVYRCLFWRTDALSVGELAGWSSACTWGVGGWDEVRHAMHAVRALLTLAP